MLPRLRSLVAAALITLTAALMVVWALPGRFPPGQSLAVHAELAGHSPMRHGDALRRVFSLQIGPTGAIAREPVSRPQQRGGVSVFSDLEFAEARPAAAPPLVRLASLAIAPAFEAERIVLAPTYPSLQQAVLLPAPELHAVPVRLARLADPEQMPEVERNDGLPVVVASDITEPEPDQTGALPSEPAATAPSEPVDAVEPAGARTAPAKAPWPQRKPRKTAKPSTPPASATAARKPRAVQKAQKAARTPARAPVRRRTAAQPAQASPAQQQQFFPYYDGSQTAQTRARRSATKPQTQPQADKAWWE